jgi:hypothetical protein
MEFIAAPVGQREAGIAMQMNFLAWSWKRTRLNARPWPCTTAIQRTSQSSQTSPGGLVDDQANRGIGSLERNAAPSLVVRRGDILNETIAIVYLSTLVILLPLDFIFLGAAGKKLFAHNVGDMTLATPRMTPAILFYVLYLAGVVILVLRRVLRPVLLRDVRAHKHGSAQALGMGGRCAGHRLGCD